MPDIGWTELLLIAVVAIVVIGPKDLPRAMRLVGQWTAKVKRMARDFQGQFTEALREAELESVKKDVEAIAKSDPMASVRKEMTKTGQEIRKGLDQPPEKPERPAATVTAPAGVTFPPAPAAQPSAPPAAPAAPPAAAGRDAK
jgi:sec-independent protein translocase protein TatB